MSTNQSHVLIVDDERFFRDAIADVLEGTGAPYLLAQNGEEALEVGRDPRVGVVILDVQLPDMTGLEVFQTLARERPELRVIILSAHTEQEYVLEALRLGAQDYLAKPIHEEELALAVKRAQHAWAVQDEWGQLRRRVATLETCLETLWSAPAEDGDGGSLGKAAVGAVSDLLGSRRVSLMLLDPEGSALRVAEAQGSSIPASEMDPVPLGSGIAGRALANAEPLLVRDIANDERFADHEGAERYDTGSFAVAPVRAGDERLGVLCAADPEDDGMFDEEDLSLLRILANQLGRKLQSVAPADAEPEAAEPEPIALDHDADADLAREVCSAVTAEVEPARILQAALRPIAEGLDAAPVSLYLRGEHGLVREAEWDAGERADRERLPSEAGLSGAVYATGALVATDHPEDDARYDALVDTPEDGRAGPFLCVPVSFRGKTLGVFRAFPRGLGAPSARTGEVLAAALSAAVRNVLLYRSLVESIEEVARARREARPS